MWRSFTRFREAKRLLGVTTRIIQRCDEEGKIRVARIIGGRRRIPESEIKRILGLNDESVVLEYARFSSSTQKDDLEGEKQLVMNYAEERVTAKFRYSQTLALGLTRIGRGS